MVKFCKEELIKVTNAKVLADFEENLNYSISTDTRTISYGNIYLPLSGENFDGEMFLQNAVDNGASAYFTSKDTVLSDTKLALKVSDTKLAYLKLANYYRNKINPLTIAITGSAGKTTTKEMVYSIFNYKYKTHKTLSNHNNEIGFCQTVLSMPENTEILIVEMGMRGLGEIELISKYLEPDYAIITNCGSAHIGRLGSLDNIAAAKCEITAGLSPEGMFFSKEQEIIKNHLNYVGKKIFYSLNDVKILDKKTSYTKFKYNDFIYELNVDGDYNIENSLSGINAGLAYGMPPVDIAKGLLAYKPIEKRWEVEKIKGYNFINDSYNANPESMMASVKTFLELYKNPVVVLGDMGELGEDEEKYHYEVGKYLSGVSVNVKYLLVGRLSRKIGEALEIKGFDTKYFDSNRDVSCYILENLDKSNTIFLKASRSMKFEEILDYIKNEG